MLVGRSRERARIEQMLDAAQEGRSSALLIRGDAGIGKTALLRRAVAFAEERGIRVVRSRGIQTELDIPFANLSELLAPLLDDPGLSAIPAPQARALAGALALEATEAACHAFTVHAAVLSLLAAAAEDGPLLAVVDDAQWMDDPSVEALLFAGRRLQREGIVLLGAQREGARRARVPAWLEQMRLGPLADADARELLKRTSASRIAAPVADSLIRTAAGNPLALQEIPSLLTEEQLQGRDGVPDPLPAGTTLQAALRRRLDGLGRETRRALLLLAAARTSRADFIVRALGSGGLAAEALEPAESAGLVTMALGRIEFDHPLVRSTVYHAAPPGERRAAHRVLAHAAREGSAQRAWHLAAAAVAQDEVVAAALEAAARDARSRGAHATSARDFARAAHLSPDAEPRARRLVEAGADAALLGEADQASAFVEEAIALSSDEALLARAKRLRGTVEMRRGNPAEAQKLLIAEADRVQEANPQLAATMLLEASVAHMMTGDMRSLHAVASRARRLAEGVSAPAALLATAVVGEALLALGFTQEGDELLDRVEPFLLEGDPLASVDIVGMAGHASIWAGRYDRAERLLDALVERAREAGAVASLIYPLAARSHLHRYLGRWHAALADAAESVELAEQTGQLPLLAHSLAAQALAEASLGHEDECRAHAERSLELCRALGADAVAMYGLAALGHLELSLGRVPEAIERLEELDRIDRRIGVGNPAIVPWRPNLVEAYVRAGRVQDAERQLERLEELAERTGQRLARVTALRGRALMAGEDGFREAFRATLAEHEDEPMPYERARTLYAYGERLRRAKQRAGAREPLREALEAFERLPSRLWAERARAELRATGQSSQPRRAESAAEQLTPHELQVAMLVGQGMTNREAAAALFLSPKTIEYHLGQIYRKLDVRSRTQLARLIAMEGPGGHPDEAAVPAFAGQLAA